ncbi:MAG: DNA replication/repair protein RecF [Anaerolineales bacterium]|nr:DNA replication/repair protein RecF [Anaerolineales bacterium]
MHVDHLSLTNFRNYGRLELSLPLGATLLYGQNAQGKTNLLEAIFYLATTRSPQAEQDQQLINWEALQTADPIVVGRLKAQISAHEQTQELELRLIRESRQRQVSFRREALINRRKVRLMDLLGTLRVVLFRPQDIELITGSPSQRRRYLDITLCQIDPIYCRALSQYNKIVEQRNALLRQLAEGAGSRDLLTVYDERVVELGSQVFMRRAAFCDQIAREAQRIHYEALTDGAESMRLHYLPRLDDGDSRRAAALREAGEWMRAQQDDKTAVTTAFQEALSAARDQDVARGATSIGPHRDDWQLLVNGRSLSAYGSRGQQRSAILALKLAEITWMADVTGETPILLLDEVVAELDEQRRALLLQYVQTATQSLLTATDPGMFTPTFLDQATSMRVENGRVLADNQEQVV